MFHPHHSVLTIATLFFCTSVIFLFDSLPALAQSGEAPPDEWGPVSINLEDIPYPHPVEYMEFTIIGKDVRMAYMDVQPSEQANGMSVVLLHGLNFFGEYWKDTIEELSAAGFRVIVPDQIGFGRSSKPLIPYSFEKKAANTRQLLDSLDVEKAVIVGHSMGGMLATRFAFSYPEYTEGLVLVNMIGKKDLRRVREWQPTEEVYEEEKNRPYDEYRAHQEDYYVEWHADYEEYIRIHHGWRLSPDWPRLAMVRALNRQMVYSQPVEYEFPHIEAPALILSGREDGPDFADHAGQTCEAIPQCDLILFDDVGHNPHFEAPERFHAELIRFLEELMD